LGAETTENMFSNKLFWLCTAFLLFTPDGFKAEECCKEKMVGGVSYTLLPERFDNPLPNQCLSACVYTEAGRSSPKFCFARGDLPTECLSKTYPSDLATGRDVNQFAVRHAVPHIPWPSWRLNWCPRRIGNDPNKYI